MGLFDKIKGQLCDVVEWPDMDEDSIFYKWGNVELKKGSKLIVRPGQDAVFFYQGRVEGIMTEEGEYDLASDIIPFLSTILGIKYGFDSGKRSEVLFVNTREFTVPWGTQNSINLPVANLPGGMPIRAYGNYICKVSDYNLLIERVAGVQSRYTIDDIKGRISAVNDQLLMKWIVKEGKDMFNIQANAYDISQGITQDLAKEFEKVGMTCVDYQIQSVSYPDSIREMQEKAAANSMIGDLNAYTTISMADGMANNQGGSVAGSMAQMQVGLMMGQQIANQYANQQAPVQQAPVQQATAQQAPVQQATAQQAPVEGAPAPKFCPNCGQPTNGAKFCSNCGQKLF